MRFRSPFKSSATAKNDSSDKEESPYYYKFDAHALPDSLFHADVPYSAWLDPSLGVTTTAGADGFPPNSLNVLHPVPLDVELERLVGIALYMIGNVLPFILPAMVVAAMFVPLVKVFLYVLLTYVFVLYVFTHVVFSPYFRNKYKQKVTESDPIRKGGTPPLITNDMRSNQYLYTERNIQKYLSTTYVWPRKLHIPGMMDTPLIFSVIPHGVAPLGITAYPLWSKLWNDRLCRWTAAPLVLKIPLVGYFMKSIGYVPAKTKSIHEALTKREENVGIILDGIAGMFQTNTNSEKAYVMKRKGICKIALRAGVPIVPVYAFGHTSAWTVVVDPFGILEGLSNRLGASLSPFFGRWGWFLGPPRRIPLAVCLGDPIVCIRTDNPTQEQINSCHEKLLEGYRKVFDTHKVAYGYADKELKFV